MPDETNLSPKLRGEMPLSQPTYFGEVNAAFMCSWANRIVTEAGNLRASVPACPGISLWRVVTFLQRGLGVGVCPHY